MDTREIGQEFRPMLRLAAPLALTELGWLAMAFTDTVMVGRLPDSATAIGAVSLGSTLFYTVGIFGSGIMLGMDTLVARLMARAGWTSAIAPCGTQSIWHASCRPF